MEERRVADAVARLDLDVVLDDVALRARRGAGGGDEPRGRGRGDEVPARQIGGCLPATAVVTVVAHVSTLPFRAKVGGQSIRRR